MSDPNNANESWNNEQAPFVAAETQEAAAAAAAQAGGAAGEAYSTGAATAGAGSAGSAGAPIPPAGGWGPVGGGYAGAGYAGNAGYAAPPPPPVGVVGSPSDPNPAAAFWLGLIPGVGAMYNGQVAKGFVHLIVFIILVSIANTVNGIFGLFVTGWIFFMAFEAYHTAKARRDGLPLPNAFGWNDIGERMGLGKNWPFSPGAPSPGAAPNAQAAAGTGQPNQAGWGGVPPTYATPPVPPAPGAPGYGEVYGAGYGAGYGSAGYNPGPNWVGYVPPTAFASAPPVGSAVPGTAGPGSVAGGPGVPPGHGMPYAPVSTGTPYAAMDLQDRGSRLPVGAIWLIGLGLLFLLGQWAPLLDFSRAWIPSIILAVLAGVLFFKRMGWTGPSSWRQASVMPMGLRIASAIRTPGVLLAVAVLNGLHQAWIVRWRSSWPWLLIVIGVLMLVERMALRQAGNLNASTDVPPTPTGGL